MLLPNAKKAMDFICCCSAEELIFRVHCNVIMVKGFRAPKFALCRKGEILFACLGYGMSKQEALFAAWLAAGSM
jgi:hypothetical protein